MLGEFCWLAGAMTGMGWVSWGSPSSEVPSRTTKAEASVDQSSSCSGCLGRTSKVKVDTSQGVPGLSAYMEPQQGG